MRSVREIAVSRRLLVARQTDNSWEKYPGLANLTQIYLILDLQALPTRAGPEKRTGGGRTDGVTFPPQVAVVVFHARIQ